MSEDPTRYRVKCSLCDRLVPHDEAKWIHDVKPPTFGFYLCAACWRKAMAARVVVYTVISAGVAAIIWAIAHHFYAV